MRRSSWVTPTGARTISRNRRWLRGFWRNSSSISHRFLATARMVEARTPRISGFCCRMHEQLQQRRRGAGEHFLADRFQRAVAYLEARIERPRRLALAQDGLAKQLQQQLIEQAHVHDGAVVALHELLDRERVGGVLVAEGLRQTQLVIEEQPILAPAVERVQPEAHLPQEGLGLLQAPQFRLGEEAVGHQAVERLGAEVALGHPGDGLDVAQAPGPGLDVGLEVVGGVIGLQVPLGLLAHLGLEELLHRPDALGRQGRTHRGEQLGAAGQQARLDEGRHDAHVADALLGAFGHGAHAVPDLQADVPQERHQALDRGAAGEARRLRHQQQNVDVGSRGAARRARSRRRRPAPSSAKAEQCWRQASRSTASMSAARACTRSSTGSSLKKRCLSSSCACVRSSRQAPGSLRAASWDGRRASSGHASGVADPAAGGRSVSPAAMSAATSVRPRGGAERQHVHPGLGDEYGVLPLRRE